MKKQLFTFIGLIILNILPFGGYSQSSSILPDSYISDWNNAGVQGGIPHYPVGVNVKDAPYNAVGDGTNDDTQAILNAIADCPEGQAVYLPEGSYRTTSPIRIEKAIVLRGAGPEQTNIVSYSILGIRIGPDDQDLPTSIERAGLEDFLLVTAMPLNSVSGTKINLNGVANSWVKNVRTGGYAYSNISLNRTSHCEVRECFVQTTFEYVNWYVPGGEILDAYGIIIYGGTHEGESTYNLVENNILDWMRHALIIMKDCKTNVFGYNFCWTNWCHSRSEAHDFKLHHPDYDNPERICTQTLGEGNVYEFSDSHGWHRYNTWFRNRVMGGSALFGITLRENNAAIGNELTHKKYEDNPDNNLQAQAGSIAHGNYVTDGSGMQWDASISNHNIPASYYLTERPDWFGDQDWPPFGGDLMPGNKRRIPAEVRYWSMLFPEESPSGLQGNIQGDEITLTWNNNSSNTVDFIICRSTDNVHFYRIGETSGTTFTDNIDPAGRYYYYIRTRNHLGGVNGDDFGGESDPSNILAVGDGIMALKHGSSINALSVFPNPAKDVLHFNYPDIQAQTISIYSGLGKLVSEKKYTDNSVNISGLDKGIYFLVIKGIQKNYHAKFIVK